MPTYDSGPRKEVQGRSGNPRDMIIISRLGEAARSISYVAGSILDASVWLVKLPSQGIAALQRLHDQPSPWLHDQEYNED